MKRKKCFVSIHHMEIFYHQQFSMRKTFPQDPSCLIWWWKEFLFAWPEPPFWNRRWRHRGGISIPWDITKIDTHTKKKSASTTYLQQLLDNTRLSFSFLCTKGSHIPVIWSCLSCEWNELECPCAAAVQAALSFFNYNGASPLHFWSTGLEPASVLQSALKASEPQVQAQAIKTKYSCSRAIQLPVISKEQDHS